MKSKIEFTHNKVQFDQDNTNHCVISLTAPEVNWKEKRPKVCIIPVIDISYSMSGDKLHYAKQSAIKLVEHLQPGDYFGLVTFSNHVSVDWTPQEITKDNKERCVKTIGDLNVVGSTNLSDGMLMGLHLANKMDLPAGTLVRVILLTDGQANMGVAIKPEDICKVFEANKGMATMSAFGYGHDAQQELLTELSGMGAGNYAFIENPDNALSAFGKELGGLLSTYAQNITLDVIPNNGHKVVEVISDVDVEERKEGGVQIKLPEILSEETRHLVLEMELNKQKKALPRDMSVVDIQINYTLVDRDGKVLQEGFGDKGKVRFVKDKDAQKEPTEAVDEIVARAQAIQAQIEAEEAAKAGDFRTVSRVLRGASDRFKARGRVAAANYTVNLNDRMYSNEVLTANAAYLSSTKSGGSRGMGTSSVSCDAAADLRAFNGLDAEVENAAQAACVASFTEDSTGDTVVVSGDQTTTGSTLANITYTPEPKIIIDNSPAKTVTMGPSIGIKDLAEKLSVKYTEILKKAWGMGVTDVNVKSKLDYDTAALIGYEYGVIVTTTVPKSKTKKKRSKRW